MAYITREKAVETLELIADSGILDSELEGDLSEIISCISHEEDGLMLWGAEDEVTDLFIAKRSDLIDDDWVKHCTKLAQKYSFTEGDK